MSDFSEGGSAAFKRAADRAKLVLKPGDRVRIGGCGGSASTVTFRAWTNGWGEPDPGSNSFSSTTVDDLSPWNIVKVNGVPMTFRDPEGEEAVRLDLAPRHATSVQRRRAMFRLVNHNERKAVTHD